jgi:thienamycin biosynthesis protein ThnN
MNKKYIKEVLSLHFDKQDGTPYWLDRQKVLGFDVVSEIEGPEDFYRLGEMDVQALRTRPITDFIPRRYHSELSSMLLSETGGTTGDPCRRVYSTDDFDRAFIQPWIKAVELCGFPYRGSWLFVGPGGPHIIDRSARGMARSVGSLEPFSVDCDVRWIKKQQKESFGFTLYLDHVLNQATNIIRCQEIDTLFTTPPLLESMGQRMSEEERLRIRGIHTGGLSLTPENRPALVSLFPNAVILPGYGNSLFGVTFPVDCHELDTFFNGDGQRLLLQLAPLPGQPGEKQDLKGNVEPRERGRVICHCLDSSFLIINMVERDTALSIDLGQGERGLSAIEPLALVVTANQQGIY